MWTAAATCVREIKKENETSQSRERFCFCVSEAGASSRPAWRNAKGTRTCSEFGAAAASFQFRRTGRTGKCDSFSVRAATITSMTGSGGEHCSAGVQFAVSTRPCTLYNQLIKCNGERHSAQPGENIAKCFLRKSFQRTEGCDGERAGASKCK